MSVHGENNDEKSPEMKECFGVSFGWFMEDMIGDYDDRLKCYECPDFDACWKMSAVRCMTQLRYEVGRAAQTVGRAYGGSHSTRPFG